MKLNTERGHSEVNIKYTIKIIQARPGGVMQMLSGQKVREIHTWRGQERDAIMVIIENAKVYKGRWDLT